MEPQREEEALTHPGLASLLLTGASVSMFLSLLGHASGKGHSGGRLRPKVTPRPLPRLHQEGKAASRVTRKARETLINRDNVTPFARKASCP